MVPLHLSSIIVSVLLFALNMYPCIYGVYKVRIRPLSTQPVRNEDSEHMLSHNSITYKCPWNMMHYSISANIKIWVMVHIYEFKHMFSEHIICRDIYYTMITPPLHTILSVSYKTYSNLTALRDANHISFWHHINSPSWKKSLILTITLLSAIYAFHKV
jgi:hypothetical protein